MGETNKSLVLTAEIALPIHTIRQLQIDLVSDNLIVITQCESLGCNLPLEAASMDTVIAFSEIEYFREQWFVEFSRVLKPSGKLILHKQVTSSEQEKASLNLVRQLLTSGFIEVKASDSNCSNQSVTIKGTKASWTVGSSYLLKNKKTSENILPNIPINEESDIIDEDSLLTEEDLTKPQLPIGGDCEVGKTRKACKNCTCGRAEAEAEAEGKLQKLDLTPDQINNPRSACGSCGLGDAFRCGGCPYRGLPPFILGEKVAFSGNMLVTDI
ncbi:anamorsin [Carex littledalei]|uniref:Anamorsin homolog n=1 Tax=Carex littledalei TaxID=544730 RepID=A0A833VKQ3_9POAL|nr:anamorsin [Carex littledalei]